MFIFKIKPDWHINSSKPLQKQLIATSISVIDNPKLQLSDINYPKPELIKTNFNRETLALYQGEFKITANLNVRKKLIK